MGLISCNNCKIVREGSVRRTHDGDFAGPCPNCGCKFASEITVEMG